MRSRTKCPSSDFLRSTAYYRAINLLEKSNEAISPSTTTISEPPTIKMKFLFTAFTVILPVATAFAPSSLKTVPTAPSTSALFAENGANGSSEKKKVIVLGGDGFCGWPTSLYLSDQGHDVVIVDNLSRRKIDLDLGCDSLTPISSPEVSGSKCLGFGTSTDYSGGVIL